MKRTTTVESALTSRSNGKIRHHRLPLCQETGLARYRDRHQARQGAKAMSRGSQNYTVATLGCAACQGFHTEMILSREPLVVAGGEAVEAFADSLASRPKRYFLLDIENLTNGAAATPLEVATLMAVLAGEAPGIAPHDHVVVGAARKVLRKYGAAVTGNNVKWVVGSDEPDGADRALLAAVDLRRVAGRYDELVIGSGDGAFVPLARKARALGLTVRVITTEQADLTVSLSRELAAIAHVRTLIRLQSRAQKLSNLQAVTRLADITFGRTSVTSIAA